MSLLIICIKICRSLLLKEQNSTNAYISKYVDYMHFAFIFIFFQHVCVILEQNITASPLSLSAGLHLKCTVLIFSLQLAVKVLSGEAFMRPLLLYIA